MMNDKTEIKNYTNGEVTIVWKPDICIHSSICWKGKDGLPEVFNPADMPWIKPQGASTERIIQQIKKCPSGALSYFMNSQPEEKSEAQTANVVEIIPDGPLLVYGNLIIKDSEGNETLKSNVTALCRCGGSDRKPYCDGSHSLIGFKG